jgi:hypothetical protein
MGWSLNILGPSLLELPSAVVRNGKLAPDGPAYKLLAFEGDSFANRASVVKLKTANKIREFAQAGLPILMVGDWRSARAYGVSILKHSPSDGDVLTRFSMANSTNPRGFKPSLPKFLLYQTWSLFQHATTSALEYNDSD